MNVSVRTKVLARGITRLCHFTPSRNLVHIATDPNGLLASAQLREDESGIFNATDKLRLDGFPDHVCCSVQYPNAWYFRKAREGESLFTDWVILFLKPDALWSQGTKFSARNAAAGGGSCVAEGAHAFESMFASSVTGAYGKTFARKATYPLWLTTDQQAEVLIPDRVAREDILGIAVASESQAKREHARLTQLQVEVPLIVIAPDFFNPYKLSSQLQSGTAPVETAFQLGGGL